MTLREVSNRYLRVRSVSLLVGLLIVLLSFGSAAVADDGSGRPKNIIYIIGDGMGPLHVEVARLANEAPLHMDGMPVAIRATTDSLDSAVTDSAAAATAHATGHRTNNGMIAMLPDGTRLTSVLRLAKAAGLATGVVVTDSFYGATPASYIANAQHRNDIADIVEQALYDTQPDVLLGGGLSGLNLAGGVTRLQAETDYTFVQTREQLAAWEQTGGGRLLGLFASGALHYEVERPDTEPTLAEMVGVALRILAESENGFFLMVEGSRIDHASHDNDLWRSVHETLALDRAVAVALEFARERGDTLVVVTADHETGGLTRGSATPSVTVLQEGPTALAERISAAYLNDPAANLSDLIREHAGIADVRPIIFQGSFTGMIEQLLHDGSFYYTTGSHTDTPVPVLAEGPGAERIGQAEHITDLGRTVIELLGL